VPKRKPFEPGGVAEGPTSNGPGLQLGRPAMATHPRSSKLRRQEQDALCSRSSKSILATWFVCASTRQIAAPSSTHKARESALHAVLPANSICKGQWPNGMSFVRKLGEEIKSWRRVNVRLCRKGFVCSSNEVASEVASGPPGICWPYLLQRSASAGISPARDVARIHR
jgi:hypothetical protein